MKISGELFDILSKTHTPFSFLLKNGKVIRGNKKLIMMSKFDLHLTGRTPIIPKANIEEIVDLKGKKNEQIYQSLDRKVIIMRRNEKVKNNGI